MEKARRVIGVGMDYSQNSKAAVQWVINNLIHNDAGHNCIILIHVQSPTSDSSKKMLFENTGSPLIPLVEFREINVSKQYGLTPDLELLDMLDSVSRSKGAEVVAKVYWGNPGEKLCDAVEELNLDSLVVGSRGVGVIKRVLLGSVSNYVVTNATCPVTVVKGTRPPSSKPRN